MKFLVKAIAAGAIGMLLAPPARALELHSSALPDGSQVHYVVVPPQGFHIHPVLGHGPVRVSAIAQHEQAEIAINGGFFNHKDRASTSFVTRNGRIVADPRGNRLLLANRLLRPYLRRIFNRTEWRCVAAPDGSRWEIAPHDEPVPLGRHVADALQAGPRLLPEMRLAEEAFVIHRGGKVVRDGVLALTPECRSALGLRPDGSLVLVAVTGRPKTGLTMAGLQREMSRLGCTDAMALDGGSSTALAIRTPEGYMTKAPPSGEALVRSVLVVVPD